MRGRQVLKDSFQFTVFANDAFISLYILEMPVYLVGIEIWIELLINAFHQVI